MVPADSRRVSRVPRYLGTRQGSLIPFAYGACTLYRRPFQIVRLGTRFITPRRRRNDATSGPATPSIQRLRAWHIDGLGCSLFARRYWGNRFCFIFLRVLRWFTSPGSPRHPMYSDDDNGCSHPLGSPIRKSPGQSLFAAHRSLSQLTTSFIAGLCQGIHRTPLVA